MITPKKCSHCGVAPLHVDLADDIMVKCNNDKCIIHNLSMDITTWNHRPIEDQLNERIKFMKKQLGQADQDIKYARHNTKRRNRSW